MGRREDNKAKKREALLTEAEACFDRLGYDGASIEQISSAAGVARGTFYLYFADKSAIFSEVVDRIFTPLDLLFHRVSDTLSTANDREATLNVYREMALGIALLGMTQGGALRIAFRESRAANEGGAVVRSREQALLVAATRMTEIARDRQLIDAGDARIATVVVYGAVERIAYEVLTGQYTGDVNHLATEVLSIFARALGLPSAPLS